MKVIRRIVGLVVMLVSVTVAVIFFSLAWLPAFIVAGGRGVDWVMICADWIIVAPTRPFDDVLL